MKLLCNEYLLLLILLLLSFLWNEIKLIHLLPLHFGCGQIYILTIHKFSSTEDDNVSPASPLHLLCPMRQFVIGSGVSMNLKILQDRSKMIPEPQLELQIFSQTRKQKLPVLKYSQRRLTENDCSRAFSKKDNRVDELFSFAFVKICWQGLMMTKTWASWKTCGFDFKFLSKINTDTEHNVTERQDKMLNMTVKN